MATVSPRGKSVLLVAMLNCQMVFSFFQLAESFTSLRLDAYGRAAHILAQQPQIPLKFDFATCFALSPPSSAPQCSLREAVKTC